MKNKEEKMLFLRKHGCLLELTLMVQGLPTIVLSQIIKPSVTILDSDLPQMIKSAKIIDRTIGEKREVEVSISGGCQIEGAISRRVPFVFKGEWMRPGDAVPYRLIKKDEFMAGPVDRGVPHPDEITKKLYTEQSSFDKETDPRRVRTGDDDLVAYFSKRNPGMVHAVITSDGEE